MEGKHVHVIAHTHWDREWYQPFSQFRYRLVSMIDELLARLDDDSKPEFSYYHLDGQTVVLEDYLELRPERRAELQRLVSSGRLLVGPWYAQPDETLVSGEALIRNLVIGMEEAEGYGGAMPVGYVPDIFGHTGQFPQILRGVGIDNALLWRGMVPPPPDKPVTEFRWHAPSGHQVLGVYLSTSGYFTAPQIDRSLDIAAIVEELSGKSASTELLLMNGADHHHVQGDLPEQLAELNGAANNFELILSTLPAYLEATGRAVASDPELHEVTGELRETRRSPEGLFLLYGTLSSRMPVKQANFAAQRRLERVVEPLAAVAMARGVGTTFRSTRRWLRHMWKTLLKNHAHDSICGCSVDDVVHDMNGRFRTVQQTGEMLVPELLLPLAAENHGAGRTDATTGTVLNEERTGGAASAFRTSDPLRIPFLLQNAAGVSNREMAIVDLRLPDSVPPQPFYRAAAGVASGFVVRDASGTPVPAQIITVAEHRVVTTHPRGFPDFHDGHRVRLAFRPARELPPLGAGTFTLEQVTATPADVADTDAPVAGTSDDAGVLLENSRLSVRVGSDGRIDLQDRETGIDLQDAIYLEDGGDIGDLYNYSPPPEDLRISSHDAEVTSVELESAGPLVAAARLELTLSLPAAASADRRRRSTAREAVSVALTARLAAVGRALELDIELENTVSDHRLRAVVRQPVGSPGNRERPAADDAPAPASVAQAAFTVERRPACARPVPVELWREDAPDTHPQHGWCAIDGPERGLAVFSRGLPEYQLCADGRGWSLAVTLLRGVGRVHARDSLTIDRRAWGIPFRTPAAQCHGIQRYSLAVRPFADDWASDDVDVDAERFVFGYEAEQPVSGAGLRADPVLRGLEGSGIIASALKPAEIGQGIVLRLWNNRSETRGARLELSDRIRSAARTTLREEVRDDLPVEEAAGRHVTVELAPWEIVTLRLGL